MVNIPTTLIFLVLLFVAGMALIVWSLVLFGRGAYKASVAAVVGTLLLGTVPPLIWREIHTKPERRQGICGSNLGILGRAATFYSMDHSEGLPPNLSTMTNFGANRPKAFVCPSSGHSPGDLANVDDWVDYSYVSGLTAADRAECVLAFCSPENHKGQGCNVLFVDGSVCWYDAEDFVALTSNPALFFGTTNAAELAEIQSRAKILRGTKPIKK